ncbi:hypothetical protein T09_8784, partial [Trichinella sp. T9]
LDTQYNVLQWLVEPADNISNNRLQLLFWSSFRSRHRVRYVKCTDFVHDSNGLPHLQTATFLLMAL